MTDFEIARLPSQTVYKLFEGLKSKAVFHLCQNTYGQVQALSLQQLNQCDTNFAFQVRVIAALALVPLDRAIEHFEQLKEHFSDVVTPVLDNFEDNHAWLRTIY